MASIDAVAACSMGGVVLSGEPVRTTVALPGGSGGGGDVFLVALAGGGGGSSGGANAGTAAGGAGAMGACGEAAGATAAFITGLETLLRLPPPVGGGNA